MYFLRKSKIFKNIIMILVVLTLFQFICPSTVHADDGFPGVLVGPLVNFVIYLGDAAMDLIHNNVMGQAQSNMPINTRETWWDQWGAWIVGILAGIIAVAIVIATAGLASMALAAVGIAATVHVGITSVVALGLTAGVVVGVWYDKTSLPQDLILPMYSISPEEIFEGKIRLFDVNFFAPKNDIYVKTKNENSNGEQNSYKVSDFSEEELNKKIQSEGGVDKYYYLDENNEEVTTSKQNISFDLQPIVSSWYNSIKNLAVVLMMIILVYIGIRIMLVSVASEKAKYKQMLKDWFVAMCILFFMHYIMTFAVSMVSLFNKAVASLSENKPAIQSVIIQSDKSSKMIDALKECNMEDIIVDLYGSPALDSNGNVRSDLSLDPPADQPEKGVYITWVTNLMGKIRLQAQFTTGFANNIGHAICFIILVFYTVFFSFVYLKRVLYLAFLTMIAPLVALTYPIDKLKDGQAQAFNAWLTEYMFNLLIQPLHLLLYTILVSSAIELSSSNILYSLVAIGFLIPAEKLLRKFFGFEKATTAGSFAGAAAGAGLLMSGLSKALNVNKHNSKSGNSSDSNSKDGGDNNSSKINFNDNFNSADALASGNDDDTSLRMQEPEISGESEEKQETPQQAMLDAYDEGFGTDEWDSQERDQMARDAYMESGEQAEPLSDEEFENMLREQEYSEDDIQEMMQQYKAQKGENSNQNVNRPLTDQLEKKPIEKPTKIKKPHPKLQRFKRAAGYGLSRVGARGLEKLSKAPFKAAKLAGGAALGFTAGTIGVAAGIASGDLGNAMKYGSAGIGAGAIAGSKLVGYGLDKADKLRVSEGMKRAYYGDEYDNVQMQKRIKEWKRNGRNREELEASVGRERAKEMLRNGDIDEYLSKNVTSAKDIGLLEELQKQNIAKNRDQAIAIYNFGNMTGDTTKMKKKDRKDWQDTFEDKYKGYKDPKKLSSETMSKLDDYYNLKRKYL